MLVRECDLVLAAKRKVNNGVWKLTDNSGRKWLVSTSNNEWGWPRFRIVNENGTTEAETIMSYPTFRELFV